MMTKKEAFLDFRTFIEPGIISYYGKVDRIALRLAWNNYVDSLHKCCQISNRQVNTWTNPYN